MPKTNDEWSVLRLCLYDTWPKTSLCSGIWMWMWLWI